MSRESAAQASESEAHARRTTRWPPSQACERTQGRLSHERWSRSDCALESERSAGGSACVGGPKGARTVAARAGGLEEKKREESTAPHRSAARRAPSTAPPLVLPQTVSDWGDNECYHRYSKSVMLRQSSCTDLTAARGCGTTGIE